MNTRWQADFINLRQQVGLEPARFLFAPTQHDPLAQSSGHFSYFIDEEGNWWRCLWKNELNKSEFKTVNGISLLKITESFEFETKSIHGQVVNSTGGVELELYINGKLHQVFVNQIQPETISDKVRISLEGNKLKIVVLNNSVTAGITKIVCSTNP